MGLGAIDFTTVAAEHRAIDLRLEAWGQWVRGGRRLGAGCAPMFRYYRSTDAHMAEPRPVRPPTPDEVDALDVEHAVAQLPEGPREALRWCYVTPYVSPIKLARYLDVRLSAIRALVHEGRSLVAAALG